MREANAEDEVQFVVPQLFDSVINVCPMVHWHDKRLFYCAIQQAAAAPPSANRPNPIADGSAGRKPANATAYAALRTLFDEAAINTAAAAVFSGSGSAPPEAMLSTNGSMSVRPTMPARA